MFTLVLPILVRENAFWRSDHGYQLIGGFLSDMRQVSTIRRHVVVTSDESVCRMAKQEGMDVLVLDDMECRDLPCTVDQMLSLAGYVCQVYGDCGDGCIIADHRNISLTSATVEQAKVMSLKYPKTLVLSVTQSRDHPCQWRSFSRFLGAGTVRFDSMRENEETTITIVEGIRVSVGMREGSLQLCISSNSCRENETVIARVVPFNRRADFTQSGEIVFASKDCDRTVEVDPEKAHGLIIMLTAPSLEGEYDTLEYFTPKGVPWELMAFSSNIRNTDTLQPIFGRQEFPPVYGFDGSFCVKGWGFQGPATPKKTIPLIVEDSYVVCDWLDYWYVELPSSQRRDEERR